MNVWVTRSEPGASRLAAALETAGYAVFNSPVLAIGPKPFERPEGPFEIGIFLSVHGVEAAAADLGGECRTLFAIGRRTRAALRALGFDASVPAVETSEGLLEALPEVAGKRVLIVAGARGRNLVADALQTRGAGVTRLDVYVRYPLTPAVDARAVDVIVTSSGDGLTQAARLWAAAGGSAGVPVLAPSARVAALGASLGMSSVHDCGGANADAVLGTLRRLGFEERRG